MRLFSISIIPSGEKFDCEASQNVLTAMNKSRSKSIASGCRGGGCGICKVEVIDGGYHTLRMSRNQISERVSYGLREPLRTLVPPTLTSRKISLWPKYNPKLAKKLFQDEGDIL